MGCMHRCIYLNGSGHQDVPLNLIKLTASTEVRKVKTSFNNIHRERWIVLCLRNKQAPSSIPKILNEEREAIK